MNRRCPTALELLVDLIAIGLATACFDTARTASIVVLVIMALVVLGQTRVPAPPRRLEMDDAGVRVVGWGHGNGVAWSALVEVGILTTDEGPAVEDVFWVLVGRDGGHCVVPGGLAGPLLPRLQALPGFDNLIVAEAMGSAVDAKFVVWRAVG
jgi:hypothetical protein